MLSSLSVSFIFGLINFLLLCAIGVYFFIKNVRPALLNDIEKEQGVIEEIKSSIATLQAQETNIQLAITQQEEMAQRLIEHSKQWATVVSEQLFSENEEQIRLEHERKARATKRRIIREQQNFAQKAAPEVLCNTERELKHYFENKDHQTTYLQELLIHLQAE